MLGDVLRAMRRHRRDRRVQQAGMRLLARHARSPRRLVRLPQCVEAIAKAARRHAADATVQSYAAEAVTALNGVPPEAVARAHGASGALALAAASVALALSAPPSLVVHGHDWRALVLAVHPRLRSQA